jgi:glycosyltransferase involved in cell wall biosynthesis
VNEPAYRVGDLAPPPLARRTEAEVMARWQGDEPVVSILCPTYQHVGFIEDALRGFLGQDTDFPFEIVVRDDASTDGTADIVRDYADRYPNIIRAVLETVNRYPAIKPLRVLHPMARGAFIALCEGDDYWIDANKIQLQLAALLRHPESVASHHMSIVVMDGKVVRDSERPRVMRNLSSFALKTWAMIPVRTIMFRSNIERIEVPGTSGDVLLSRSLGLQGSSTFIEASPMAAYRLHKNSWSLLTESSNNWKMQRPKRQRAIAKEMFCRRELLAGLYWGVRSVWNWP